MAACRIFLCMLVCALLGAHGALAAQNAPAKPLLRENFKATYSMYTGGFDVVDIDGSYGLGTKSYNLQMLAYTKGILGKLAPWKGDLATSGLVKGNAYLPQKHSFSNWWKNREERTSFTYDKGGNFKSMELVDDTGKKTSPEIAPELSANTKDMLSSLATMLRHLENTGNCNIAVPTFDGRRKFDMKFTDTGMDTIKAGRYSVFSGPAHTCTIEIVPVAGKWHEKPRGWMSIQEQSKANKKLPRIWVAKPAADLPAIPVRFEVYTKYGNIIMHLKALK